MKLLAIDTATEACSVALFIEGDISQHLAPTGQTDGEQNAPRARKPHHSGRVLGMVEALLQERGVALRDLDALAVDTGPGAFTGVRIGIGVAQGLAYGAALPVIPITSLEALAHAAHAAPDGTVLPAIDARMQQIYYALYQRTGDGALHTLTPPALADPAELTLPGQPNLIGLGSGWDHYAASLLNTFPSPPRWLPGRHPEAAHIAQLATARGMAHSVPPQQLSACYVRNQVVG